MNHILIPTDFSTDSLKLIHAVAADYEGETLKITMLHMLSMPIGIQDLLFLRRPESVVQVPEDYKEYCQILRNMYKSRVVAIDTVIEYGDTVACLRNYLQHNGVTGIAHCTDTTLTVPCKSSIDMMRLLKRCGHKPMAYNKAAIDECLQRLNNARVNVVKRKKEALHAIEE